MAWWLIVGRRWLCTAILVLDAACVWGGDLGGRDVDRGGLVRLGGVGPGDLGFDGVGLCILVLGLLGRVPGTTGFAVSVLMDRSAVSGAGSIGRLVSVGGFRRALQRRDLHHDFFRGGVLCLVVFGRVGLWRGG